MTIIYSLAQEGKGHSTRARELIGQLKEKAIILTGGDSLEALQGMGKIIEIPSLRFTYDETGKVRYPKTVWNNRQTLLNCFKTIKDIERIIAKEKPRLAISDFEPFLPRAALRAKIPLLTIDNQHRMIFGDVKPIKDHRLSYLATKGVIKMMHPLGNVCIVSSVFNPVEHEFKYRKTKVYVMGPTIKSGIVAARKRAADKGFVLCYAKHQLEPAIIPQLEKVDAKLVIYVKDPDAFEKQENIAYKKISLDEFTQDLSQCSAVIASAGEQLVSEALFMGKPAFLIPEGGTFEQQMNAQAVKELGVGDFQDVSELKASRIEEFLDNLHYFKQGIERLRVVNATPKVLEIIRRM